jgi:hypothetical protein
MVDLYFIIAIVTFILNGIAYNLAILEHEKEIPIGISLRAAFIYMIISLFWFIQVGYFIKLAIGEFRNGKSN